MRLLWGSFPNHVVPWNVKYDIQKLKQTIEKDQNATVIFYGGEPLMNPKFIMQVMDNIKVKRWGIQTNGIASKASARKILEKNECGFTLHRR